MKCVACKFIHRVYEICIRQILYFVSLAIIINPSPRNRRGIFVLKIWVTPGRGGANEFREMSCFGFSRAVHV